mgnify:FL=1
MGLDFIEEVRQLEGHYFVLNEEMEQLAKFVEEKIEKDINWFDDFFKLCEEEEKEVLSFEGKNDLDGLFNEMVEAANATMAIEFIDYYGLERYIKKISDKLGMSFSDVIKIVKPHKKTLLMQYQDALKGLKNEEIQDFVKKWQWVGTHFFMGTPLTAEKVKAELASRKDAHNNLFDAPALPAEYSSILSIGSKMAFFRAHIVECIDKVAFSYWPTIKKIGEDNGLSWQEVINLTHHELIKLRDSKVLPKNFKERKNGFGLISKNGNVYVITGNDLKKSLEECEEKISSDITEIKGTVSYPGKVRGVVKIIEESKNISKLKKGDILVANETTPDYIIGMRRAGAIITNQGGVTSHAAINSREMKIPCIIGTKIATKVLKDGDLVEVDAYKGIVKIIK